MNRAKSFVINYAKHTQYSGFTRLLCWSCFHRVKLNDCFYFSVSFTKHTVMYLYKPGVGEVSMDKLVLLLLRILPPPLSFGHCKFTARISIRGNPPNPVSSLETRGSAQKVERFARCSAFLVLVHNARAVAGRGRGCL
jgi:hypothetical protein